MFVGAPAAPASNFRLALPGYQYQFPRDHASHPAFATEWWYYTGHLQARQGRRFGYQVTFFRVAMKPELTGRTSKWAARDIILGHLALTDETQGAFYYTDRVSRAALGLAGAESRTPHIWLGNWALRFRGPDGKQQIVRAGGISRETEFAVSLTQTAKKPPIIHGQNGISQKSAGKGRASHYYSFTRLATEGTIRIGRETFQVNGQSWFDHEFGSNQLAKNQVGWDWFSIQLADGRELMLYHLRLRGGGTDPYSSGTLVERNGRARHLKLQDFKIEPLGIWRSPTSGANYPARWRVTLPREGMTLDIQPTVADQELITQRSTGITYWEGSIRIQGTQRGRPISGAGYVELTGYAREFNRPF